MGVNSVINKFNLRVYGICVKNSKILLVKENLNGYEFTKFPGGGLEFGEGLKDGLRREIMEEMGLVAEIKQHFYTTDFFQASAFKPNEQIISIYYLTEIPECPQPNTFPFKYHGAENHTHSFYWIDLKNFTPEKVTLPIDKIVALKIKTTDFK